MRNIQQCCNILFWNVVIIWLGLNAELCNSTTLIAVYLIVLFVARNTTYNTIIISWIFPFFFIGQEPTTLPQIAAYTTNNGLHMHSTI